MSETLVLGLGNPLMGDDGLGLAVIARLRTGDEVAVIDGGTAGLALLSVIEPASRVLIVDAIDGDQPAGSLITLADDAVPRMLSQRISPHEIDLRHVLALAQLRGTVPSELRAIGLQPARIAFGEALSPAVRDGLPALLSAVVRQLHAWGHDAACTS